MMLDDSITTRNLINTYCNSLFSHTPFSYFSYIRIFDDNNTCLASTQGIYINQGVHYFTKINKLMKNTCRKVIFYNKNHAFFLERNLQSFIEKINRKIPNNLEQTIYVINKYEHFVELSCFSSETHIENLVEFYINHADILDAFSAYFFNQIAQTRIVLNLGGKPSQRNNLAIEKNENSGLNHHRYNLKGKYGDVFLSLQEKNCLLYTLQGMSSKLIARNSGITQKTVESHLYNLKCKLGCHTKNELFKLLIKNQWGKMYIN